ncbi:MAG: division/cell wall cluster transcriptional repressor MraZ [Oscillospiraceae bacterium]|nr:division/cell wall cluster transcriptional repressor MraZ [Oscillospiraceae bacterium]
MADGMCGKYRHAVDAKGRLFVPSKLRDALGDMFYVTLGLDHCLSVYTQKSWQRIMERYAELPMAKARSLRFFFANAAQCEPDKQGRFLLPADLRSYASLGQDIYFIGQSDHAEIWNAELYEKLEEEQKTPENLTAALEELGF